MKQIGKCINFDECDIAKNGKQIFVKAGEGAICPECERPLRLYRATMPLWIKLSGSLGIIALIGGTMIFFGGKWFPPPEPPLPQDTPITNTSEETNNNKTLTMETPTIEFVRPTELEQPTIVPEPEPEPSETAILMTKLKQEIEELKDKIKELEKRGEETSDIKVRLARLENEVRTEEDKEELNIVALEQRFAKLEGEVKKKLAKNVPNCLSSVAPAMQQRLPIFFVPTMQERTIPDYLHIWMKKVAPPKINESAFFIMRREVTVGEFQRYVNTLNALQQEELKSTLQQETGKSMPKDNPVASVPWWAAKGYADWFSKQTGCSLTLPTYNQWVVATIRYAKPKAAFMLNEAQFNNDKPKQRQQPKNVVDLLGNLREWSLDECGGRGHYILGEDYKTWRANIIGEPICESSTFHTIGFRLVLQEGS